MLLAVREVGDLVAGRSARRREGAVPAAHVLGDGVGVGAVNRVPGERHLAAAGGGGGDALGGAGVPWGRRYEVGRAEGRPGPIDLRLDEEVVRLAVGQAAHLEGRPRA